MKTIAILINGFQMIVKVDECNRIVGADDTCHVCGGGAKDIIEWLMQIGAAWEIK